MRRRLRIVTLVISVAATAISAPWADELPSKPWPFTAAFMGSGMCYGALSVRDRTISWLTHYSQCQRVQFEILEYQNSGNIRDVVFHLTRIPTGCRFQIIHLHHDAGENFMTRWYAHGFVSKTDYIESKKNNWNRLATSQLCGLSAQ